MSDRLSLLYFYWRWRMFYSPAQRLMHHFNLHHTRTIRIEGDEIVKCDWCGLSWTARRLVRFVG